MRLFFALFLSFFALQLTGCDEKPSSASSQDVQAEPPDLSHSEQYLLTYYDDEGLHLAENIDAVPQPSRAFVRVESKDPSERIAGYVWVADLTTNKTKLMKRSEFEAQVGEQTGAAKALEEPAINIVLYGTDWCGVCKQAAKHFKANNIPFIEKNIEEDRDAYKEMMSKSRAQGLSPTGVPVIDVNGTILTGFSPERIESLLKK